MIELWNRFRNRLRRDHLADELERELRFHQMMLEKEQRARGLSPVDAAKAARREMGNRTSIREESRDMWSFMWFEDLMQDLRIGLRGLRRSPVFTTIAALTLALGIGANTAIFSVVYGVLFSPFPYASPERLVLLWERTKEAPEIRVSYPNYLDWRQRMRSFEDIAIFNGSESFNLTGLGDAERIRGGLASGNLFNVLGVEALVGRTIRPEDDRIGAHRVALITHALWQRRFGGDSAITQKSITLDGFSYSVVGVLPERVRFGGAEIWLPIGLFTHTSRYVRENHPGTTGVGRLKPGVTVAEMQVDMNEVSRGLSREYPENRGISSSGGLLTEYSLGAIRPALLLLTGAVGLVLLIACANVANLVLGRAQSRQREMALRAAIGARRGRLVRQLLTESVLLSLIGGVLGTALAWSGVRLLLSLNPTNLPRLQNITVDETVLAFAFGISILAGVVFGLIPALQTVHCNLSSTLKEGGRSSSTGRSGLRSRNALMVTEVALSLVLLVGAGLLLRSFAKLAGVDTGVDPHHAIAAVVRLPSHKYPNDDRQRAVYNELAERMKAIPGVTAVALGGDLPLSTSWQTTVTFDRVPVAGGNQPLVNATTVNPEWFPVMGMRVLAGRGISPNDIATSEQVVVIGEAIAKRYFKGESAVGRRFKMGQASSQNAWITIVGVVNDVKDGDLGAAPRGMVYFPMTQNPESAPWIVVRTAAPPATIVPLMRRAMSEIDNEAPLSNVQTLDEWIGSSLAQQRFSMLMLSIFAGIALLLAAVGIYGVVSYSVAQRTQEIGLRIALGAHRRNVLGMVVRQVLAVVSVGLIIGAAGALAAGRTVANLLFGITATDPTTFVGVSLLLTTVALVAAALPAWRAARIDPVAALRG